MGRKRSFDIDVALDQAMEIFWRQGFDGASISELTAAMGINPPSLYAAFDSKEGLFLAVVDRYSDRRAAFVGYVVAGATARDVAERSLFGMIELATDVHEPPGCLLVKGQLTCSSASPAVAQQIANTRLLAHEQLYERLCRAQRDGDLPADSDPALLARFLSTMSDGIGLQAQSGASRIELKEMAALALSSWPSSSSSSSGL